MGRFQPGRGRNTGRGNAGRGGRSSNFNRNRNSSSTTKSSTSKSKKTLADHVYYVGSAKQASDYVTTTQFIINHIKKQYDHGEDIAFALENMAERDLTKFQPQLQRARPASANETDVAEAETLNEQYKMQFQVDYDKYKERVEAYKDNKYKAYALIWGQCNSAMKSKVQSRKDYYTDIKDNPIELLKAIKQHATNYSDIQYDMRTAEDAMTSFLTIRQREDESIIDFLKRFKNTKDVFLSHIGKDFTLPNMVRQHNDYPTEDEFKSPQEAVREAAKESAAQLAKQVLERFIAFKYLRAVDQTKYGSVLAGLNTQFSLGNDQYPKTLTDAHNVISAHRWDPEYKKKSQRKKDEHERKNNDKDKVPELNFAQMKNICYCCGKNHKLPDCPDRWKTPKEEWHINKDKTAKKYQHMVANINKTMQDDIRSGRAPSPQVHTQQQGSTNQSVTSPATITDETSTVERDQEWQFACLAHVGYDLSNSLLLDSCSSEHLMCNKAMVHNIKQAPKQLDMASNGGNIVTTHQADMNKAGKVWFNQNAIANILSLGKLADKYRITFDSAIENAFNIHTEDGIIKFNKNSANLYEHRPSVIRKSTNVNDNKAITPYNHVQTVEENMKMYTPRQIQQAKAARDLLASLGTPTVRDMKTAITTNAIKNVPVTVKDIDLAEQIFGPDLGTLKGKTTRRKPLPMVTDQVAIPPELYEAQQNVDLGIDVMYVNELPYFTSISKRIMYRTAQFIPSRTAASLYSSIDTVFRVYNTGGFTVTDIYCDNEFKPMMDNVKDELQVEMHYSNPDDHVPEPERNNRTIKERIRATFHRLPYKALPIPMMKRLVSESARKLNYFPSKHGISAHYSPRMIMHRETLDYDKHCKYSLGDYVQAHRILTPSNRQDPRTIDGIYLRPVANGHEVYTLGTQAVIVAARVTKQPVTPTVIEAVEAIAESQGQKGLRIRTKRGKVLYDSSWTAGVDYTDENEDNDEDDEDEDYTPPEEEEDEQLTGVEEESDNDPNTIGDILQDNIIQNPAQEEPEQAESENDNEENSNNQVTDEEEETTDENEEAEEQSQQNDEGRPVRNRKPNIMFSPQMKGQTHDKQTHIMVDESQAIEYDRDVAQYAANFLTALQNRIVRSKPKQKGNSFLVTYSLKKGLEKFKDQGYNAARGEMEQLHDRKCWQPIKPSELQGSERKKALESLIFLVEKKSGKVKARHCANGSVQRKWMDEDKTSSPTVMTESVLLTATIDAEEGRDVATMDIPNAFIQTEVEETDEDGDRIIMKIRGAMVDMLLEIDPDQYAPYVMYENGQKVLYVHIIRAIYGMLLSAILFYKKFRKAVEGIGYQINPYDPCVANKQIGDNQHTIMWHVDDLKSSIKDPKVNDKFIVWLNKEFGKEKEVTVTRGKKHVYLGMVLDYSTPGEVKVDMKEYVQEMLNEFPLELPGKVTNPNNDKLFKVESSKKLEPLKHEVFHTFVAKSLFLTKRARPDILPTVAFLCTRVDRSTYQDWTKLVRLMDFLKTTKNDCLTLKADNSHHVIWSIDAAFAVHPDMKSHSGGIMTLGKGAIQSMSKKQKLNTRSSTESELIAVDDGMSQVLWTKYFLEAQGYKIHNHIIHQDNESTIKLEKNGPKSIGKRSRHINIRYFFITDQIDKGNVEIRYCPTDEMEGDYMTKPLQGTKFHKFRKFIMNLKD